ncbi:MAG: flippase-like domain-containing protein [Alphaproteobacteria bacterium]|nr:flippase-like domain-containing protein [Alphaproteobacteria bacterium]
MEEVAARPDALQSFRKWVAIAIALSALGFIGYGLYKDLPGTLEQLASFRWSFYLGVLLLTLVNYGLRYGKWHFLLYRLGVRIPHSANLPLFLCGLAMVISPAKAGEVVKPYLVKVITGTPMQRTIPALVAERVTDGIAVVALATLGVTTFAPDRIDVVLFACAVLGSGFAVLLSKRLSLVIIGVMRKLPVVGRVGDKLEEAYMAMRECLSPVPLVITVAMSLAAWWAECLGLYLVYMGLGAHTSIEVSTFLYAFATTAGGFSPGGLGVTDLVLGELGLALIPTLTEGQAVAASLLIRIATLWFGVVLGALALLRIEGVIQSHTRSS